MNDLPEAASQEGDGVYELLWLLWIRYCNLLGNWKQWQTEHTVTPPAKRVDSFIQVETYSNLFHIEQYSKSAHATENW